MARNAPGTNAPEPIVIIRKKRIKSGHGAHHGGAWKVAYADFVTAMMAFFLLLWLLNVTEASDRAAIANYFDPTAPSTSNSGANGVMGGQSIIEPGAQISATRPMDRNIPLDAEPVPSQIADENKSGKGPADEDGAGRGPQPESQAGQGPDVAAITAATVRAQQEVRAREEQQAFSQAQDQIEERLAAMPELAGMAKNLMVDTTPEGLRIQLVDSENQSMFQLGSAQPQPNTVRVLAMVAQVIAQLPNKIVLRGHTDALPFKTPGIRDNWDLSTERANASRRALLETGIRQERIASVVGKADTDPLDRNDPKNPANRRISIVLQREAVVDAAYLPAGVTIGADQ